MIKLLVLIIATTLSSLKANDDPLYISRNHSHAESYFYIFKGAFRVLIAVAKVETGENYEPSLRLKHIFPGSNFTPNKTYYLMEPQLPGVDPKDFFGKVYACKDERDGAVAPYYKTLSNTEIMESKALKDIYKATLLKHLGEDLVKKIEALDSSKKTQTVITKAPGKKN